MPPFPNSQGCLCPGIGDTLENEVVSSVIGTAGGQEADQPQGAYIGRERRPVRIIPILLAQAEHQILEGPLPFTSARARKRRSLRMRHGSGPVFWRYDWRPRLFSSLRVNRWLKMVVSQEIPGGIHPCPSSHPNQEIRLRQPQSRSRPSSRSPYAPDAAARLLRSRGRPCRLRSWPLPA